MLCLPNILIIMINLLSLNCKQQTKFLSILNIETASYVKFITQKKKLLLLQRCNLIIQDLIDDPSQILCLPELTNTWIFPLGSLGQAETFTLLGATTS